MHDKRNIYSRFSLLKSQLNTEIQSQADTRDVQKLHVPWAKAIIQMWMQASERTNVRAKPNSHYFTTRKPGAILLYVVLTCRSHSIYIAIAFPFFRHRFWSKDIRITDVSGIVLRATCFDGRISSSSSFLSMFQSSIQFTEIKCYISLPKFNASQKCNTNWRQKLMILSFNRKNMTMSLTLIHTHSHIQLRLSAIRIISTHNVSTLLHFCTCTENIYFGLINAQNEVLSMWKVERFYNGMTLVAFCVLHSGFFLLSPSLSLSPISNINSNIIYERIYSNSHTHTNKHTEANAKTMDKLKIVGSFEIGWLLNKHLKMCPINHLQTFCGVSFADTIMQMYEIYCSMLGSPALSVVKFMTIIPYRCTFDSLHWMCAIAPEEDKRKI